jgi:septal ring factor EnvC (AmiA/AmiB activator)
MKLRPIEIVRPTLETFEKDKLKEEKEESSRKNSNICDETSKDKTLVKDTTLKEKKLMEHIREIEHEIYRIDSDIRASMNEKIEINDI